MLIVLYDEFILDFRDFERLMSEVDSDYLEKEPTPKPAKTIGKPKKPIIYKKHIYFHCRSMLR